MIANPIGPPGIYLVRGIYRGQRICRVITAPSEREAIDQLIDQLSRLETA